MQTVPLNKAWILWGTLFLGLLAPTQAIEPEEWFQAVHKADQKALSEMLAQGAEVDQKNPWGRTALTVALMEGLGDDQLLTLLLEAGADPAEPLYPILHDDKVHALERWLATGNPADLTYGQGTTPLVWAAMHGQTAMVQVLLEAGADPNQESQEGLSPLAHAQQRNQHEAAKLLLPVTDRESGLPALNDAVRQGKCELAARLLADGADPDSRSPASGRTPLMDAAEGGHLACVEALLAAGADPQATAPLSSPLNEAAWSDQPQIVARLLAAGADACQGDVGGRLPPLLQAASRDDMVEPLRLLLAHCPKVDLRHKGTTALCMASAGGNPTKVQMLIDAGADPNARCAKGLSPLHMAALWGHLESLQLLMSAGAQSVLDDKGRSPQDLALDRGHSEAAALLEVP